MAPAQQQYQLYRESSIGRALTDTLDELIQESALDPQTAMTVAVFNRFWLNSTLQFPKLYHKRLNLEPILKDICMCTVSATMYGRLRFKMRISDLIMILCIVRKLNWLLARLKRLLDRNRNLSCDFFQFMVLHFYCPCVTRVHIGLRDPALLQRPAT